MRRREFLVMLALAPLSAAGMGLYASRGRGLEPATTGAKADGGGPEAHLDVARLPVVSPKPETSPGSSERGPFFVYMEVLTADRPSVYGYMAPQGCMPSGQFKRKERIVFRFEVLDIATGRTVTSTEAASVRMKLPFGYDGDADFKQRGEGRVPDAPWTWDYCWDVPPDYPLGTLDYGIAIATKDGRSAIWKPPALVDPSRGIDSRPQIIE